MIYSNIGETGGFTCAEGGVSFHWMWQRQQPQQSIAALYCGRLTMHKAVTDDFGNLVIV